MGVGQGICCMVLCNRILFYFLWGVAALFWVYCCVGGTLIPQGFSPWNLGHFLLVQKVTKDTPRGEGFRFISAPRASLRSVALRNAPAGAAPLPWEPLSYRKRQGLRPFSLIFSRGCNGKSFRRKQSKKVIPRPDRMRPKGPQGTEIDTEKSISAERQTAPPAERQRRKRGNACERCSNFKHDL